jgi:hypothetical protein
LLNRRITRTSSPSKIEPSVDDDPETPNAQDLRRVYTSGPWAALVRLVRPAVLVEGVPGVTYRASLTAPPD